MSGWVPVRLTAHEKLPFGRHQRKNRFNRDLLTL